MIIKYEAPRRKPTWTQKTTALLFEYLIGASQNSLIRITVPIAAIHIHGSPL
jgi:hypothetical protein